MANASTNPNRDGSVGNMRATTAPAKAANARLGVNEGSASRSVIRSASSRETDQTAASGRNTPLTSSIARSMVRASARSCVTRTKLVPISRLSSSIN
ncbi:MAG: hypothetical protein BWZ07_02811 [Alphaproteobacteria bacterium ADurb.BinA280]|nr:MAG: hypothetical protein BWZ07_02811 [Alphaproteobacteria bacterium ADurb.BinA280]